MNPELLEQLVDLSSEARGGFGETLAIVEYRPTARRPDSHIYLGRRPRRCCGILPQHRLPLDRKQ